MTMNSRLRWIGLGALAAAALVTWISGRMQWIEVAAYDDKSGSASYSLTGSEWSTELSAVALVFIASAVAVAVLRPLIRRIIGAVVAALGVVVGYAPLGVLAGTPDPQRARSILLAHAETAGAANSGAQNAEAVARLTEWARLESVVTTPAGPILGLVGCAIAVFGGILLLQQPGSLRPRAEKYEKRSQRREKISSSLAVDPDSERVLWDALDEDIDPTDSREPRSH